MKIIKKMVKELGQAGGYSRSLDRALWTYGHLFNDVKSNKNRKDEEGRTKR